MFPPRSRSRSQSPSALPLNGLPINTKPTPRYSNRRSALSFFGTAALTGIVFHLLFIGFGGGEAVRDVPGLKEWLPPKSPEVTVVKEACPDSLDPIRTHSAALPKPTYHPPTVASGSSTGNATFTAEEESSDNTATMDELRKMISQTRGYYGRDYSLGLGWNNVSPSRCYSGVCISGQRCGGRVESRYAYDAHVFLPARAAKPDFVSPSESRMHALN